MKATVLLLALALGATAIALTPASSAVGICTKWTASCGDYVVCVGYSWGPGYFKCERGVRDPTPCTCPPLRSTDLHAVLP